jgi:hypothetical protein
MTIEISLSPLGCIVTSRGFFRVVGRWNENNPSTAARPACGASKSAASQSCQMTVDAGGAALSTCRRTLA